jgi:hypothetical protein
MAISYRHTKRPLPSRHSRALRRLHVLRTNRAVTRDLGSATSINNSIHEVTYVHHLISHSFSPTTRKRTLAPLTPEDRLPYQDTALSPDSLALSGRTSTANHRKCHIYALSTFRHRRERLSFNGRLKLVTKRSLVYPKPLCDMRIALHVYDQAGPPSGHQRMSVHDIFNHRKHLLKLPNYK